MKSVFYAEKSSTFNYIILTFRSKSLLLLGYKSDKAFQTFPSSIHFRKISFMIKFMRVVLVLVICITFSKLVNIVVHYSHTDTALMSYKMSTYNS